MFNYTEDLKTGNPYRQEYLDSLQELIKELQNKADAKREGNLLKVKNSPEKYREELKKMLGWPLTEYTPYIPECEKQLVVFENGINIYRMQIKLFDKVKFYGIYFEHSDKKNLSLVICQHGGWGTPELCSGLLDRTNNYHEMTERVLKYNVNAFAPQMLIWKPEDCGIDFNRHEIDAKLKQLGSSIAAVEIYALMKSLDYLLTSDSVNKEKIGMLGLSYGGFFTLFTTAIDTRIRAALSCSWYNNRCKYSWVDWVWFNSANKMLDNEVAMLVYPRYLCIAVGEKDDLFMAESAKAEYEKLKEVYDEDKLDFLVFDGGHEFLKTDIYIEKLIKNLG